MRILVHGIEAFFSQAVEQRIRSKSDLQRKQDKISRKYSHLPNSDRDAQLSSGYLEGALEEVCFSSSTPSIRSSESGTIAPAIENFKSIGSG